MLGLDVYGQDWDTYLEDNDVKIEFASLNVLTDSTYGEKVIFRYTNKTDKRMRLKFVRKVNYVDKSSVKERRHKYKVFLEPNEVIQARLDCPLEENSIYQLFIGWNNDPYHVDSFMIDKVNHM
jgi:hypothetical protein